jgi:hypothetical protein
MGISIRGKIERSRIQQASQFDIIHRGTLQGISIQQVLKVYSGGSPQSISFAAPGSSVKNRICGECIDPKIGKTSKHCITRNMKLRLPTRLIFYAALLLTGMLVGVVVQRYMGLGNILRSVGVAFPTRTVLTGPNDLPVMEIPKEHRGRMRLFILAGQSNMVGWSPIPEGVRTDPRIYVFGKDYRWRIADHPIEDASNQVDMVSENRLAGFGPGMDFAFGSLERHPDIVIGLIPCAKNASGIIQWQRDLSDQSLYGSCLKRARAASPMGEVVGILFFQGETEAQDPVLYPEPEPQPFDWAHLFTTFITDFRSDLHESDLPVIFAQIGADPVSKDFPNWKVVQDQQSSITLPWAAMITTDDLPLLDGIHFTVESYRKIGRRFADAYWDLVEQAPVN